MAKKLIALAVLFGILALLVASCASPTPQIVEKPVIQTQIVEKQVVQTQVVEKQVIQTQVVEKPVIQTQVVEKVVEKQVQGVGPNTVLNVIMVQHALCAWDSFWCTVEAGIRQGAADAKVNVQMLGPDKFDLEKTAQLIDQAVAAKPDGIGRDGDRRRRCSRSRSRAPSRPASR